MNIRSLRIDDDTYLQLLAISEREERTVSDIMRQAMRLYVEKMR